MRPTAGKKDIRALSNSFCGLVRWLRVSVGHPESPIDDLPWPGASGQALDDLAERLTQIWPERFEHKYVKHHLRAAALRAAALTPQDVSQAFVEFFAELESFNELKLVEYPLEGVELGANVKSVRLGPFTIQAPDLERAHSLLENAISQTSHTHDEKRTYTEHFRNLYSNEIGKVIVQLEVVAESKRAHSIFLEKSGGLVDLLQASTELVPWSRGVQVGLAGQTHAGRSFCWIFPINGGGFLQPNQLVGAIGTLVLHEENVEKMRAAGVMRLAEALAVERQPTELETSLLRVVHWLARAIREDQPGQRVVSCVICFESIVRTSSARSVAEDVALLLGDSFDERRYIHDLIRKAYDVRNKVVHEGDAGSFKREFELIDCVWRFLTRCIWLCDELDSPAAVQRRIAEIRFQKWTLSAASPARD